MNTINNKNNTKEILEQRLLEQQLKATYATKHWLHLILSILTAGLWLPVWLIVGLSNMAKQRDAVNTSSGFKLSTMQIVGIVVLALVVIGSIIS